MRTFLAIGAIVSVLVFGALFALALELLPYLILGLVIGAIIRTPRGRRLTPDHPGPRRSHHRPVPLHPRPHVPLLVQFLVGHPTTSRITVHGDGEAHLVRVHGFTEVADEVCIVRGSHRAAAEPGTLMVPAHAVFELVEAICSQRELPGRIEMVEQDMD